MRRARPIDEPPVARALPLEEPPAPVPRRSAENLPNRQREKPKRLTAASSITRTRSSLASSTISPSRSIRNIWTITRAASGRANAYFSLGECYRNLNRPSSARTNFQKVLNDYGDSEFAGPAAYALAEMAFTQKDYAAALPLFHRSATKSKESAVALSARYFEARCLEVLGRKDEAC